MQDEDEVVFMIEHDEYMRNFLVSIVAPESLCSSDLAACLRTLAQDMEDNPDTFFKYKLATNGETH